MLDLHNLNLNSSSTKGNLVTFIQAAVKLKSEFNSYLNFSLKQSTKTSQIVVNLFFSESLFHLFNNNRRPGRTSKILEVVR